MTLNIVVPMAGEGSRFADRGYSFPKPLIQMPNGDPMIKMVMDCLECYGANWIFIVRQEHEDRYHLSRILPRMLECWLPNDVKLHMLKDTTEGAACTVLEVESLIRSSDPLIVVNSDQYFVWDSDDFFADMDNRGADGGILTFKSYHPKWSFVKLADNGDVTQVAEKEPISNDATVGLYWWKHGSFFVDSAKRMIEQNDRVNGEFYVAPTFNYMLDYDKKVRAYNVDFMAGVGTPEDLDKFQMRAWLGKIPRYDG